MNNIIYQKNLEYFEDIRLYDEMTPKERNQAISNGEKVDRMPVNIMADLVVPQLLGMTVKDSEMSARNKADTQIAIYKMFGVDGIGMMHGLYSLPIALGGKSITPKDTSRTLTEPPIKDISDLSILDLDNVSLEKDEAAKNSFDAIRYVQEAVGEEIDCTMNFTAPFTVATGIVGIEKFVWLMAKKPEVAEQILDFTLEAQYKLAEKFMKEGIKVGTSDPVASPTLIRPTLYRKYAKKYEMLFAKRCMECMKKPMSIHICGNTTKILSDIADCGFSTFSLDNLVDLAEAKDVVGDRMCLVGNVDPVKVLYQGTAIDVMDVVDECYRKTWDSPKGFAIHTGCDMPHGTPIENVKAYLKEAKLCAKDQALAVSGEKTSYVWDKPNYE